MNDDKCNGYKSSGYWKGYPCGAVAKYTVAGKRYCANHAAVAQAYVDVGKVPYCDWTQDDDDILTETGL